MRFLLLLVAALTASAQRHSLASTDDGRQLYFAANALIYRITDAGVEVFAEIPPNLPGYHDPNIQPALYMPFVSGDGRLVGYNSDAYCPQFYACQPGPYTTGELRGSISKTLGQGTLSVSHNGRWALLTARDYGSIYPGPNSFLTDLESGKQTLVPYQVWAPVWIADDGSIVQFNLYASTVWRPDGVVPLAYPAQPLGVPIGISADARVVVSQDSAYIGNATRFFATDLPTGSVTVLELSATEVHYIALYGISNDGQWVLYSRDDRPDTIRLTNTVTAAHTEIPLPAGEMLKDAALSGYANAAFLLTSSGRITAVDLENGVERSRRNVF